MEDSFKGLIKQGVQAMPLVPGKTNLTSGTDVDVRYTIKCVEAGTITLKYVTGEVETIPMEYGDVYGFHGKVSFTTGRWFLA